MEARRDVTTGKEIRPRLLILGASTRAAAWSAFRAGFSPICADRYADEDLKSVARVVAISNYPNDLCDAVKDIPSCPWIYTGALENHPAVIASISSHHTLWGNTPEVLRKVRDPFWLHEMLVAADLPALPVCQSENPPPQDGTWMLKPLRGGGGRGVQIWGRAPSGNGVLREPHYFQQRSIGKSVSALFVGTDGDAVLVGVCRQWVGSRALGAPPFAYCGSLGPIELSAELHGMIARTGSAIARAAELRGLFGIDFQLDGRAAWPVEVNPRYPASTELIEYAWGEPLLEWHQRACEGNATKDSFTIRRPETRLCAAKAILYASRQTIVPSLTGLAERRTADAVPIIADIPAAGTVVRQGHPICTTFAQGNDQQSCLNSLKRRVRQVMREM